MSTSLPNRILEALAREGASSRKPLCAAEIMTALGADEAAFWSALETLVAERVLQNALIQRQGDAEAWLAIWPSGITQHHQDWTGATHAGLFGRDHLVRRMPRRPDPDRDPRPDLSSAARGRAKGAESTRARKRDQQSTHQQTQGITR